MNCSKPGTLLQEFHIWWCSWKEFHTVKKPARCRFIWNARCRFRVIYNLAGKHMKIGSVLFLWRTQLWQSRTVR